MEFQFPLAEPEYTGKRTLDFAPFAEAMDGLKEERTATLDGLLAAATLLDMQRRPWRRSERCSNSRTKRTGQQTSVCG